MTNTKAMRVVCEAALLDDDNEAASLLRESLDTLTEQDEAQGTLLIAYAWVDPEDALRRCQSTSWEGRSKQLAWDSYDWMPGVPDYLEQIHEAYLLHWQGSEAISAYATITALLPLSSPKCRPRRMVHKLAIALNSPEEFLTSPNWESCVTLDRTNGLNVFLLARLWKDCPVLLWQEIQKLRKYVSVEFLPVGQWVLSAQNKPENIPLLIAITKWQGNKPGGAYGGKELSAVFKTLEVLEAYAPQELRTILPMVLKVISKGMGAGDSILTAYALVLIARLNLNGLELVRPLVSRIRGRKGISASRRWARQIQRRIRLHESAPPLAHELAHLLRVMALERTIDGILIRSAAKATEEQTCRARRWLRRSEPIILSVVDKGWRDFLYQRKALLESKGINPGRTTR